MSRVCPSQDDPDWGVAISSLWSLLVSSGLLLQYLAKIARLYICTPETVPTRLADMPEDLNGKAQQRPEGELSFRHCCQPCYIGIGSRRIGNHSDAVKSRHRQR